MIDLPPTEPVEPPQAIQQGLLADQVGGPEEIRRLLREKGYPENTIAGIMGNIHVETGGSFDYRQKQKGGGGHGLFQFDHGMKKAYLKHLKDSDLKDSARAQIDFMHDAIFGEKPTYDIGSGHRKALKESFVNGDPADVAKQFMERFERPGVEHADRRQKATLLYALQGARPNLLGAVD